MIFREYRHANVENGFGFRSNQVKLIEVYDGNDEWDDFGGIFWVRDKNIWFFGDQFIFLGKSWVEREI